MRQALFNNSPRYKMNEISTRQLNSYLVVSKEGPDEVNLNVIFDYKVIVSNLGTSKSTTTTITDIVPSELKIISVNPQDKVTINGQVVTYVSEGIDISDEAVLTIKVKPIASGLISNKVSVDASNNENPTNEAQKSTNILNEPPQGAYLQIIKQGPSSIYNQQPFEYAIDLVNSGNEISTNTVIEDTIPSGLVIDSVTSSKGTYTIVGQKIDINIGSLNPSEMVKVTIKVSNPVTDQTLINVAQVNSDNNTNPINQSSIQTEVVPKDQSTTLLINKTSDIQQVNVGDIITYTILVNNTGNNPSTKTTIEDNLPDEVEYISSSSTDGNPVLEGKVLKVELNSIQPLQTVVIKIIVRAIRDGIADNIASVFAQNNTNPNNTSLAKVNIGNQPPFTSFLVINKSGKAQVNVGDEFDYTINIKNIGDIASTQATITDIIPNELKILSTTTDKGVINLEGQKITITIDSINITDNINITIKVKAIQIGNIINTALIEASNNSNPTKEDSQQTEISTQPQDSSFLDIQKQGKENVEIQEEFNYVIAVKNIGQGKSTPANIIDTVPNELQIISVETIKGTAIHSGQNVDVSIPEIDADEIVVVTIKVKAIKEGSVINTANVFCANNINQNTQSSQSTNITGKQKKSYTTGPLKKNCYDNKLRISMDNTTSNEFYMKFTAQNLSNPNDKKDYDIKIPPKSSKYINICDLPEEYKITFDNIEDGIYVLITSCCNCYVTQIIRQKDLIPE